jgi:hypothetical protein
MPKITRKESNSEVVYAKTKQEKQKTPQGWKWWNARTNDELKNQVLESATFLKTQQQYRFTQAGIYAKLYGNQPLYNFAGSNLGKIMGSTQNLPVDRPTMNVVQSCIDTLVSRISQAKPRPLFLTDNGDYKQRKLAKQMNDFISGELYQTKAYDLGELMLRDGAVFGTGCLKIYETDDHKIALERKLLTEVFVDPNDAYYGKPTQMFELKLVDRSILQELFPKYKSDIALAEQAFPENSADGNRSISDQIIIVEAWHLPSSKTSNDGRHVIICSAGKILDEPYTKDYFPFAFFHYSPRPLGFWGQGLAEQLMGTQSQINEMLITISRSINLVGVPRVFVEAGSKVGKASLNNNIGAIVPYSGTKPIYEVAPCIPQEMYAQLERLIQFAYQQSGISALAAAAQKPAGLNSGEAIRSYDDLQSDRFAALQKRYANIYEELAYKFCDMAKDIAERTGSYQTIYPNKDGTKEINLPEIHDLNDPFVIQCYDTSSLPKEPAGRLQKVTEMMQAGLVSPEEGRRLLDFPDIEQVDKLANASEERILKILDEIVDNGKYTPPDPFMDLLLAEKLVAQYYNLYVAANLEESKAQKLRDFFTQIQTLKQAAMPPPPPMMSPDMMAGAGAPVQGVPEARPTSDLLSNVPIG